MKISENLTKITGSATAQIFAKAKEMENSGKDIVHLEIGQPDFSPPEVVLEATKDALDKGYTTYSVSRGNEDLRKRIAIFHEIEDNMKLNHKSEVIVTAGAKISIFAAIWSVTNPNDNVIVLNPSWVSYADMITALGAEVRFLPVDSNFQFSEDSLRSLIDENTTACVVNSPSNPTGAIISPQDMKKLFDICSEHEILLISDEMYSDFIYEGQHTTLASINEWKNHGVIINGFSKTFSMTGFRLGYSLGNEKLINNINKVIQLTTTCPVNFGQYGAITALDNIDEMREFINNVMVARRDLVSNLVNDLDLRYVPPQGSIYAWLGITDLKDSISWSKKLLDEKGVAVTPGRAFGPDGEGFIRLCFATSNEEITRGISRIGEFLTNT